MSVEVRKSRLGLVYTIRYKANDGRIVRETLGLKSEGWNKTLARKEEQKRRLELRAPTRIARLRFKEVADRWHKDSKRDWKTRTQNTYARSIVRLKFFHGMWLDEIRPRDVKQWIDSKRDIYHAKTINCDISVLYQIFDYAMDYELIMANPAAKADRPKIPKRKWRILTPTEIQAVDEAFTDDTARLIFRVLWMTGIRRDELRKLKVEDLDFERKTLRVVESKTPEGERVITLPTALCDELEAWCDRFPTYVGELVFLSPTGKMVNGTWYTTLFKAALEKAGVTDYVRPFHDMRHTSITGGALAGESPIKLMKRAGHRSFETTEIYLNLAGAVFHDEAEALEAWGNGGSLKPTQN